MRRGEIWVARLHPNVGGEIGKIRPVVILLDDRFINTQSPVILAAPLTTQLWPGMEALRIRITPRGRLLKESHIVLEQMRAMDRSRFGEGPLTMLTAEEMALVEERLMAVFGIFIPGHSPH